ncbi:MAG: rod shape-determining protein MreD [Candidatus Marinimicrobia bacterium]|nr:rod shape-determining protein MreD [Candidatus Neomarinimicrobiota bacterium]MCF7839213.1 rod shape-determining protein MreD [Candidatus Neomarinimicrobiota bacterium]
MKAKHFNYIIAAIVAMLVQWMLQPIIAIGGIGPNFLVIFIIAMALRFGPIPSVWTAFVLGLVNDALTATDLMGLTAFGLAVVGYIAAQFKGHLNKITPILQYVILFLIVCIYYLVNDFIAYQSLDWRFTTILLGHILPASVYTFIMLFFVSSVTQFGEE